MQCPFCGKDQDKVIDSRSAEQGKVIRRRRECTACDRRFTTYERVEETVKLYVVKRDGTRVPYERQRLMGGLEKACYKRPIPAEKIQQMVEELEDELYRTHEREVQSSEIGRMLSDRLRHLDKVAYVRFASVYKQFKDVEELLDEVRDVIATSHLGDPKSQGKLF